MTTRPAALHAARPVSVAALGLAAALVVGLVVVQPPTALADARSARIEATPVQEHALDCEAAALQIALAAIGINVSQNSILTTMGADTRPPVMRNGHPVQWGNPYQSFVGNVNGRMLVTGYGVYYPPVVAAAHAAGANAYGQEGAQPATLYAAVAAGNPVVVWVPHLMSSPSVGQWTAWDGTAVWYSAEEHTQVLIGYDYGARTVTLADPLDGRIHTYSMSLFESRFASFHSMAIVVSPPNGPAAIVSTSGGDQTLFWKGTTNTLYEAWSSQGAWSPPVSVGGSAAAPMASEPSAAVTGSGQQIVFWQGTDGLLHEMWWQSSNGWNGPVTVDGGIAVASAPSVIATASNQTIFWKAPNGQLEEAWWNSSNGWNGPYVPGAGGMTSSPSAINSSTTAQTVFWKGSNGELEEAWWTPGSGWNGPVPVAGGAMTMATAPSAMVTSSGEQIVFWQASDRSLHEATWTYPTWTGPINDGSGPLGSSPSADVTAAGGQSVFWKGTDANIWTVHGSGSWSSPANIGLGPLG